MSKTRKCQFFKEFGENTKFQQEDQNANKKEKCQKNAPNFNKTIKMQIMQIT